MPGSEEAGTSRNIAQQQRSHQREEFRAAVRALLMTPLMTPAHEDFPLVRRQADMLRGWFSRETGWPLHIEQEGARLYKRPAELSATTRGLPDYDRRRYVLLCLACAALERSESQITLRVLGERLLQLATEPALASLGFVFTLGTHHERRELVAVCKTLLEIGVLQRVVGDEDAFVHSGSEQADALYDVQRRTLAGVLAAVRGPSTWRPEEAPETLDERLSALVDEHVADSDEGRRTALRHGLARRLLDDPVIYVETLNAEARAYFVNQRGAMSARLCDAAALTAEHRAEGLALVDETCLLTDVAMPAEGTDAHATLLVAEHLAGALRISGSVEADASPHPTTFSEHEVIAFLRDAKMKYGRYWRKSAREAGAERELAAIAIERLEKLHLIEVGDDGIRALPAIARFGLGETEIRDPRETRGVQAAEESGSA
ncbi:TIGR02678 family protein [Bradyrhizobium elkanii]|uniref:TIGR02678 family protein n=1 Tax=Bradyrhizobium elkanii TaxID=29448 RepID=A0A4U6RU04_BRAEL|nr:TIGR02678 family protein [Bradyrhizobium elkanii]TKV77658.1 TIGR02678 family protein [Bradyrhizobium elkanii]